VAAGEDDTSPISWMVIPRRLLVVDGEGGELGRVDVVLGDSGADIFHGLVVDGRELPAAHVVDITSARVETDLTQALFNQLPEYHEVDQWELRHDGTAWRPRT
jgi:hypothetical protein